MVKEKEIQFLFRLDLNAIKQLWCNANIQMLFSNLFNLGECLLEEFSSSIYAFVLCWHKLKYLVLLQVLFPYANAIFTSNHGIISSYADPAGIFLVAECEVEKGMNNSSKFLDLDGNMFVWVLLKLRKLLI